MDTKKFNKTIRELLKFSSLKALRSIFTSAKSLTEPKKDGIDLDNDPTYLKLTAEIFAIHKREQENDEFYFEEFDAKMDELLEYLESLNERT